MTNSLSVLAGTLISLVSFISITSSIAFAQPACVTQNMVVPPGANSTDKAAPFFIDTAGLDFKTSPPTRDPANPNYPRATELPDGTLPPPGAEGNFIIGPTHKPAPGDHREGRRASWHDEVLHAVVEGQHDLQSRPHPR